MAKTFLISIVFVLSAFTLTEILAASRYRRATTATTNIATSEDLNGLNTQLRFLVNATTTTPSVNRTQFFQIVNNITDNLNISKESLQNITQAFANGTVASITDGLNQLKKAFNGTSQEFQNDLQKLTTLLNNNMNQTVTTIGTLKNRWLRELNVTISHLQEQLASATGASASLLRGLISLARGAYTKIQNSLPTDDVHKQFQSIASMAQDALGSFLNFLSGIRLNFGFSGNAQT